MLKPVRNRQSDALAGISWQEFERLLVRYYSNLGFQVEHCGTAGSGNQYDGGIDLKLRKANQYVLVQCKHWNAKQVPHNDVHQLMGVMQNEDATGAVLVSSGEFTTAARQAAGKKGRIELIDGAQLREMLGPLLPAASKAAGDSGLPWLQVAEHDAKASWKNTGRKRERQSLTLGQAVIGIAIAIALAAWGIWSILNTVGHLAIGPRPVPHPAVIFQPNAPQALPESTEPRGSTHAVASSGNPTPIAQISASAASMDAAALAEWKRKNEEAMRILEKTTPELGKGATKPSDR